MTGDSSEVPLALTPPHAADGDYNSHMDDESPHIDEQPNKDEFWFWVVIIVIAFVVLSYLSEMFPVPWFED
jgi:hypothetical protein